jgi:hypothetical protein
MSIQPVNCAGSRLTGGFAVFAPSREIAGAGAEDGTGTEAYATGAAICCEPENPKSEARNPKESGIAERGNWRRRPYRRCPDWLRGFA